MKGNTFDRCELKLITTAASWLPRVRGADLIVRKLWEFHARKKRDILRACRLGFELTIDPMDKGEECLLLAPQLYNYTELGLLRKLLSEGDVFLDLGAFIGIFTLVASRAVGRGGTIVAVEADPINFARLRNHLELNAVHNVTALNVGLSDRDEVLRMGLTQPDRRGTNSFLYQDIGQGVAMQCRPLAEIVHDLQLTEIKGIKIDIEGFEYRVLKQFFRDVSIDLYPEFILTEHIEFLDDLAGGNVVELLRSCGYRTHWADLSRRNHLLVLGNSW